MCTFVSSEHEADEFSEIDSVTNIVKEFISVQLVYNLICTYILIEKEVERQRVCVCQTLYI